MTSSHSSVPVPDALLGPVLEDAADVLRSLDSADVPGLLRPVHGFDRRGLLAGPGRRQLFRALTHDDGFRARVVERFCARDEVRAILDDWQIDRAFACIDASDARRDLPLLASALWAARPQGAEFALGLLVARADELQRARDEADEERSTARALAEVEEGRRRAAAARMEAEAEVARLTDALQKERSTRRRREDDARADATSARREVEELQERLDASTALVDEERMRAARAEKRAAALQEDVKRLRSELERAHARAAELPATDARALADVAAAAEQIASTLRAIERRADSRPPAGKEPPAPRRAPVGRARPPLPPGVAFDSPEGIDAMVRGENVLLVVDGYNVTKRAWGDATPADQRERLGIGVTALHRRAGCGVLVVFDGDGSGVAHPVIRRGGVRVVFSDAGEQADDVIVREVGLLPKRVPIVVVSSDAWIREQVEAEGAVVVGADAFLRVLRPER